MHPEDEKTIDVLNDLIEICRDGQQGFKTAAEEAEDQELARTFQQYSSQRGQFIQELQDRVRTLGGNTEKSGSVTGSLHRGWINLKSAISSNEPHAVLAECERGEDAAVDAYREALDEQIDGSSRQIVLRQLANIQEAHDRVKMLRDSPVYAKS